MTEIAKGVLGGGWSLVAGWILPAAVNIALFGLFLLPDMRAFEPVDRLAQAALSQQSLVLLTAAVVLGLLFSALQTPLYRVLEGYLGWPSWAFAWGRKRQQRRLKLLRDRLDGLRLAQKESGGQLTSSEEGRLRELRADRRLAQKFAQDLFLIAPQRALLRERLRRFPLRDEQVLPTRLGNALRRMEQYGSDRYRLDSQVFWHELIAAAPEQTRQGVTTARIGVDFFVCLLYGHLILAATAVTVQATKSGFSISLSALAVVLTAFAVIWYRLAVSSTEEWAMAIRALVNLGRKPLAEAMGLELPATLHDEREMWSLLSKLSRLGYHENAAALDRFRAGEGETHSRERPAE
ncbi:hypothetical protein [Micromonospora sp. SL4-19]|uniref:hypothetical protein n=1 Tax=Micromonospora sp. SL4-19 TaxID=3399129 RepID=UPI003A4D3345